MEYTGSIGCNVSIPLADLLAPIVGKTSHHIKQSKRLANEMAYTRVEQYDMFLLQDVESLFTNTPINEGLAGANNIGRVPSYELKLYYRPVNRKHSQV